MPQQTNKQNSFLLSGDGEWHIDEPMVVGKYTRTKQRWLRAKIVKSGHDRHYKEAIAVYRKGDNKHHSIGNLKSRK